MRILVGILALLVSSMVWASGASPCPVTVGTLTLNLTQPRTSCVSPCLLFFDTTGSATSLRAGAHTTDTATLGGINDTILDVYYAWSFGDPNASGTGTWANGSRPGVNVMNQATGPVAAHLYILPTNGTTDLATSVQVWAYDGTNIATCTVSVTVFAPSGANGFSGTNTVCAFNATQGTGCPAGAGAVTASTLSAAAASLASGKRVLLKCGDSFTGGISIASTVVKASLGAYGGCENTTTSRPILNNTSGNTITINGTTTGGTTDVRIADLDFEDGTNNSFPLTVGTNTKGTWATQITMYNLKGAGYSVFLESEATQSGLIASSILGAKTYNTFPNVQGSACINNYINNPQAGPWDGTFCGNAAPYQQSYYANISYNAFIGNSFDSGLGTLENQRMGVCRMCIVSNNTYTHTQGGLALLKFHEGHYNGSNDGWDGQFTEINEVSDNLFTNPSAGYPTSYAPQNTTTDERMRYLVMERNLWLLNFAGVPTGPLISATQSTLRNNVIYSNNGGPTVAFGYFATHQGGEPATQPGLLEAYNNTCYAPTTASRFTGPCVEFDANGGNFIQNNLFFNTGSNIATGGVATGNTINSNTTNSSVTFNPVNHSGSFTNITDFKPQAAATGASSTVPNYFDATGLSWIGAYQLGALSHSAPAP